MNKFRTFTALVLILVMALALTACGSTSSDSAAPASTAGDTAPSTQTETGGDAAPASEDKPINLSLSVGNYANNSVFYAGMEEFAKKVNEYSGGTITADIYTDNSLGDLASQVDAIVDGSIDVLVAGDSYFAPYYTALSGLELPFLFESADEARYVLDSAAGDYIKAQYEGTGIKILSFWEVGMRQFTSNGRMLNSIEDVQGMRLRVLPVDIQIYAWELFGAQVIPIDGAELFSALQTGIIDAQENPLEGIWGNKLYENQQYISLTNHVFTPATVAMSENTWAKLSPAQQDAVVRAMVDATALARELATTNTEAALQNLMEIREVNENPDVSGFVELAPQVYAKFFETNPEAEELINMVYAARDEFRGQ